MKTTTVPSRGLLPHVLSLLAAPVCALSLLATGSATAESVDSELLLLVDVSNGGLKRGEFDRLIDGYADALTSSSVLDSIASGATGKIAVSLSFYGVRNAGAAAGVDWMSIGSLAEAQIFASQLRSLSQPLAGSYSYQDALTQGLIGMGDETGGPDNGFQSAVQIVEVAGSTRPGGNPRETAAASANALTQGVDMIGATVVGNRADQLEGFYASNIIGGSVGAVTASVSNSAVDGGLSSILTSQLSESVGGGAIAAVPEPSSAILLMSSMGFFLLFSRNRAA
ncbi:DUF1194 domain-containing protein [Haloferula sp.]|uniref:DUF1194 domain-containing protein n=1 Tax=Haloferula sp. TaxID=2497595 RepID=UPI00329DAFA1